MSTLDTMMVLIERDEHRTWKMTAFAEGKPPVTVRHLCGGMSAAQVGEMVSRNSPGTYVLVADITDADSANMARFPAGTWHREPEYSELEAQLRAHDAREPNPFDGVPFADNPPETFDV